MKGESKVYQAPISEISFILNHVAGLKEILDTGKYPDVNEELVTAILTEAGKFAEEEIAPLNKLADEQGAKLVDGSVHVPKGWKECYARWIEAGWNSLTGNPEFGGQGLPLTLLMATMDIWNAASMAFGICPTLTIGAFDALETHGSDELKQKFMENLVSGKWTGTMNLTEPQAGSDLNELRTRAERNSDGSYRIFGQKIFITYGDHELTENIIHFVLARLPDAPEGTAGISLFLVPKVMVNDDGTLGERNDVTCIGVEEKLGIHASPTCTLSYGERDGAIGYLVGEENQGLACMFTMMNSARLAVGIQGVGVSDRATQQAEAYARERKQGRDIGEKNSLLTEIANHPDIKRSILLMRSKTMASRAICYCCAQAIDMSKAAEGAAVEFWQDRAAFLTPFAKALSTDLAVEVTSTGVQIHGGTGYIEETGAAQHFRDSRILPIYEGTNGIQAIDLVMRKIPISNGEHVNIIFKEIEQTILACQQSNNYNISNIGNCLKGSLEDVKVATEYILSAHQEGHKNNILAGATPYLRLFGLTLGGHYLAKSALASARLSDPSPVEDSRILEASFFAANILVESSGLSKSVINAAESVLEFDAMQFAA